MKARRARSPSPFCRVVLSIEVVLVIGSNPSWLNTTVYAPLPALAPTRVSVGCRPS